VSAEIAKLVIWPSAAVNAASWLSIAESTHAMRVIVSTPKASEDPLTVSMGPQARRPSGSHRLSMGVDERFP
jgi:hypothetical protein